MSCDTRAVVSNDKLFQTINAMVDKTYAAHPLHASSVELRGVKELCSVSQPVQFGVFATQDIPIGTKVMWYGGKIRHVSEYMFATPHEKSHVMRMRESDYVFDGNVYSHMFRRPVVHDDATLKHACQPAQQDAFLPNDTNLFAVYQPIGFMINAPGPYGSPNLRVHWKCINDKTVHIPFFKASRLIRADEQLLYYYHNETNGNAHTDIFKQL